MSLRKRFNYLRRIYASYVAGGNSQLSFWHENPAVNANASPLMLGEYYMTFLEKADYGGPFDPRGIPLLDYRGVLGRQYNPIAIAQYALGNYNRHLRGGNSEHQRKFLAVADWLVESLERNSRGLQMWMHHFDWEYRDTLVAPWYSALAQGQGISVLARAYAETGDRKYRDAADAAFECFYHDVADGGVTFTDKSGDLWYEEYVVDPPTHILNGFMWASWGVYDHFLVTGRADVRDIFDRGVKTLLRNLHTFDTGFWSLYEHSGTMLPMIASNFYHRLHIVQLRIMALLTGEEQFRELADRWEGYRHKPWNSKRALAMKAVFKVCYY